MSLPPAVQQLQQAMEAAMDELQTKHLIPLQKQAFVCSAACCDKHATNIQALQECTVGCQERVQQAHQILYGTLESFQQRFQRCLVRCDDLARESLPSRASEKDIAKAQAQQMSCMDSCANEYRGKVPKLKADMAADMQALALAKQ